MADEGTLSTRPERTRRILLAGLREKLIPWAEKSGVSQFILCQPPFELPESVNLTYHKGLPLGAAESPNLHDYLYHWPEKRLHAMRSPRLCCVLEGEIDWRIGITEQAAERLTEEAARCDYHILSMPAGTFFLMPAGVPYPSGEAAHWERPGVEQELSTIFWMQILASGVLCHLCHSAAGRHFGVSTTYVSDSMPGELTGELIHQLQTRSTGYEARAQSALVGLLRQIESALSTHSVPPFQISAALLGAESVESSLPHDVSDAVRAACYFIQANLHRPLSVKLVASQADLSVPHLSRLFQAQLGKSIMQFARERRIHIAKALLRNSALPVQNIGEMVGYPNPSHFARIFAHQENISPLAYRGQKKPKGPSL